MISPTAQPINQFTREGAYVPPNASNGGAPPRFAASLQPLAGKPSHKWRENMTALSDKIVNGTARAFGWSRDFTGDLLGTVGGSMVAYFAAESLLSFIPYSGEVALGVTAAMLWKRARRDNP